MGKENKKEVELEAATVLCAMKKYWIIVLAILLVLAAIGGIYTRVFVKDRYSASVSFWVKGSSGSVSSTATMGAAQMATNYIELVDKDILLRRAVSDGGLAALWGCTEDVAVRKLRSMLSAGKSSDESFVFTVSVTADDPESAYRAADAVQYAMISVVGVVNDDPDGLDYLTLVGEVHSVDDVKRVSPPYIRNIGLSMLIALVISAVTVSFIYIRKADKEAKPCGEAVEDEAC